MSDDRFLASIRVPGRIESVRPAASFLVEMARSRGVPVAANRLFEVAIVEALTNALDHNARSPDAGLQCEFELIDRRVIVRVLDEAAEAPIPLAAAAGPPPWAGITPDAWDTIPESGYGLYLIQSVFPVIRAVSRGGRHGLEMEMELSR